jgi:TonB-linked SusC/RagA family outer membrane protein
MRLWGKFTTVLAGATLAIALQAAPASAQATGTVTGTVVDATSGRTLESAQVYIPALNMGGLSNAQGRFLILNVPAGSHELRVELIGYSSVTENLSVTAGQTTTMEVRVNATALRLQELVVTGVAGETPRIKLPFTVEKVDFTEMPVPAASAEGLLQGKVAGVKVQSSSGKPGDDSEIMLRGPTTITGSQSPLMIIDGVITDNTMADIDALDVESVEIVKGAAAASLYGSRAQNGVINIRTRRGSGLRVDQSRITLRNEYGNSDLPGSIDLTKNHPYRLDAAGNFIDRNDNIIDINDTSTGDPSLDNGKGGVGTSANSFQQNAYPGTTYNQIDRLFDAGTAYTNYIATEGRTGTTNYRASFSNSAESGVVDGNEGFDRRTFRINLDHQVRDNFDIAVNTYYAKSHQDEMPGGAFFNITFMGPHIDLLKRNPNDMQCPKAVEKGGCLYINPDPRANENNPLYQVENLDLNDDRQRFMAAVDARWSPASFFDLEANYSVDRYDFHRFNVRPLNYANSQAGPNDPIIRDGGDITRSNTLNNDINASITASFNKAFGDLTARTKMRYLLEDQHSESFSATGQDFGVGDVPTLDNITGGTSANSSIQDVVAQGYFFITALDYQGKYMGDFLVRRDGSSLFGPRERWQTYYRASGAWRLAQEDWWSIDAIDEFKIRYSLGTAGGRPGFNNQYETYSVSGGVISPQTLGNAQLKPELSTEQEVALEMVLFNKVALTTTYVDNRVEDQLLNVPLPGYAGFQSQWQNAGTLETNTFEVTLETSVIERPDLGWSTRINFDRTRQEITELNRPPYRSGASYIREGEALGTYYGDRWATDCAGLGAGATCGDFQVNDDGYMVYVGAGNSYMDGIAKDLWGTRGPNGEAWGRPIKETDPETGSPFLRMGVAVPDFNLNWSNTVRWGNLQANVLLDGEFGADKYNGTRQWAMREWRGGEADQAGKADGLKKPVAYYSDLYNVNADNSHYVEDGTYVKLREVSLRYTLDQGTLEKFGGGFGLESASFHITGRNLLTWTDYQGYDPEVGGIVGGEDSYQYPNFRTITAVLELVF